MRKTNRKAVSPFSKHSFANMVSGSSQSRNSRKSHLRGGGRRRERIGEKRFLHSPAGRARAMAIHRRMSSTGARYNRASHAVASAAHERMGEERYLHSLRERMGEGDSSIRVLDVLGHELFRVVCLSLHRMVVQATTLLRRVTRE